MQEYAPQLLSNTMFYVEMGEYKEQLLKCVTLTYGRQRIADLNLMQALPRCHEDLV